MSDKEKLAKIENLLKAVNHGNMTVTEAEIWRTLGHRQLARAGIKNKYDVDDIAANIGDAEAIRLVMLLEKRFD